VTGGDLDVAQVHARVQHGRDEGMAEHVRVRPGNPHARSVSQAPEPAGGGVAVHPVAAAVEQDWTAGAVADCPVKGPAYGWR
jgi:hypothetical protein